MARNLVVLLGALLLGACAGVGGLVRERAGFDLRCQEDRIDVSRLGPAFVARGPARNSEVRDIEK